MAWSLQPWSERPRSWNRLQPTLSTRSSDIKFDQMLDLKCLISYILNSIHPIPIQPHLYSTTVLHPSEMAFLALQGAFYAMVRYYPGRQEPTFWDITNADATTHVGAHQRTLDMITTFLCWKFMYGKFSPGFWGKVDLFSWSTGWSWDNVQSA